MGRRRGNNRDKSRHRVNHDIRFPKIRVIDPDGDQLGIMTPDEGREKAQEYDLDLVEVAPNARPPVCRIMDYGKFRYEQSKKKAASKASQVELKTIRLRPKTDDHDLNTKLRKASKFLEKGDKVKFVMRMRGRERAHIGRWVDKMNDILEELTDIGEITHKPNVEGRVITSIVEPGADA